jgi:hypothetical protein
VEAVATSGSPLIRFASSELTPAAIGFAAATGCTSY